MATVRVKRNAATERALAELAKKASVKVGWVDGQSYQDGGITFAQAAYMNEFGVPKLNIPPRPFLRPAVADNRTKWKRIIKAEARKVANGESSANDTMIILGRIAALDVKKSIASVWSPPLKPATIAARARKYASKPKKGGKVASEKPLVDSGDMMAHCHYEVGK